MKFNRKEIIDIFAAWLIISAAFAILLVDIISITNFMVSFAIASLTVGISFITHEMMHKFLAQKYGFKAHFVAFYNMLFLALAFSFLGFIIAAPGAVIIEGRITREKNGKISFAGPATNIALALLSLLALISLPYFKILFFYSLSINSILAIFNLIPVQPFDGGKIYSWNKKVYFSALAVSALLFLYSYTIKI